MLKSAHAFLLHLVDYAGMFPPAKLPLEAALGHYLQYRRAPLYAWMLGRFVCPTTRLEDAARLATSLQDTAPVSPPWITTNKDTALLHVAALGQPIATEEGFLAQLDADIGIIQDFRRVWEKKLTVDMLELAIPRETSADRWAALLPAVRARLYQAKLRGFLEIPWPLILDPKVILPSPWTARLGHHETYAGPPPTVGLKLRCGGTTAEAFPSAAQIAAFIVRCRDACLPWKATAGLHHPYGFWDASLNLWHHGFLNVFGAGLLALSHPLRAADIEKILSDREGRHFRFDMAGFSWKDWSCSLAQIAEIRSRWALSFGSCSFTEPCEDLRALDLLDETVVIY